MLELSFAEMLLAVITLAVLLVASYLDLKTREVPDLISYGFLFAVLGLRLIFAVSENFIDFFSALLGGGIFLLFGLTLFYFNQWGGADVKLFAGLGMVVGLPLPLGQESFQLGKFFLYTLFIGALYGILWISIVALTKRKIVKEAFFAVVHDLKGLHIAAITSTSCFAVLSLIQPLFWPLAILPVGTFYLLTFVYAAERICFFRKVSPDELTEGDWLAQRVQISPRFSLPRKVLEVEDLAVLRKLAPGRKITIKDGVPFVPGFLIAFLLYLLL